MKKGLFFIYQATPQGPYALLNSVSISGGYIAGSPRLVDNGSIAWSNSGESFAIGHTFGALAGRQTCILVYHIEENSLVNLTDSPYRVDSPYDEGDFFIDFLPAWSSDDSKVYFSRIGSERGIYSVLADG